MKLIRLPLICLATVLTLYIGAVVISSAIFGYFGVGRALDVSSPSTYAVFGDTGFSADVYNRLPLAKPGDHIVLIGASNMVPIPTNIVASRLGHGAVSNMSIDGSTVQDWPRIVSLAYEMISKADYRHTTFVAGVWYGTFLSEGASVTSPLNNELTRFGIYKHDRTGRVILAIPQSMLPIALLGVRPFILSSRIWESLGYANLTVSRAALSGSKIAGGADVFSRNVAVVDTAARRAMLLDLRNTQPHAVANNAFVALGDLAQTISQSGGRLVIVDLPIPSWHAQGAPAFADYQKRKGFFLQQILQIPGVSYVNMQSGFPDDDFYDSVHPKPIAAVAWAKRIGDGIRGAIGSPD